jgi:isocitrate dehydrogenase (NAD+)
VACDYLDKFAAVAAKQLERAKRLNAQEPPANRAASDKIIIGTVGGDGIGPVITKQAKRVLEVLLKDEVSAGKAELRDIEGLTIENRLNAGKAIPDGVLAALKECHVILKGPTTTPDAANGAGKNIESANVAMRRELDLFANVRPVRVPEKGIDWVFFRENTEGAYAAGSQGFEIGEGLCVDFTFVTEAGTRRIIRAAFEHARQNGRTRVTAVTKANIIKTTDGKFLTVFREMAKEYPGIEVDDWYIDIMTAKLIDEKRRGAFQVFVLPNLYGDILTDEAAEFQGGVGTAGSANIGGRYAMFEAVHGSAPRMVAEGRDKYADPCSVIRAAGMLLSHVGYQDKAAKLNRALDKCASERKVVITGTEGGATGERYADYIIENL